MKIAILSNVNLDMLIQMKSKTYDVFQTQGYGQWIHYALNTDEELNMFNPKCIFVLIDGFALLESFDNTDAGRAEIDKTMMLLDSLANRYSNFEIAISTINIRSRRIRPADEDFIETVWINYWNEKLKLIVAENKNVHRFELNRYISEIGENAFYSDKMWYMGSIPYSLNGLTLLSAAIDEFLTKLELIRKKVLVLDLDNTLWGGVLGEDGINGIVLGTSHLGAVYRDTQKRIKELKNLGVLLAIVSKNNLEDVIEVFRKNEQMVLNEDDFVAIEANWDDKAINIQKLAQRLNLGLDSFVFLDDNDIEREAVAQTLPEVTVPPFPKDVSDLPKTIYDIYKKYYWQWTTTNEDKMKTEQYKNEELRHQALKEMANMDDYLLSLNMKITINEVHDEQVERVVQLINKTNQFNTCTIRLSLSEFMEYRNKPNNKVYAVSVTDKYGDSGLISVVMVRREGVEAIIDNMLLSCRVMGRQIENSVIEAIENKLYLENVTKLNATYIPTAKNKPVEKLWDKFGFKLIETLSNGTKKYERYLNCKNNTALIKAEWE